MNRSLTEWGSSDKIIKLLLTDITMMDENTTAQTGDEETTEDDTSNTTPAEGDGADASSEESN